jgi:mRNA interferase MazF
LFWALTMLMLYWLFISTQMHLQDRFDMTIVPSSKNGLKRISLLKLTKLATIEKRLALGRLGTIDPHLMDNLNQNLSVFLDLNR